MTDKELKDILDNAPIQFGLIAQGKWHTVREMRAQGNSWEKIGKAIGWTADAVRDHYLTIMESTVQHLKTACKVARLAMVMKYNPRECTVLDQAIKLVDPEFHT